MDECKPLRAGTTGLAVVSVAYLLMNVAFLLVLPAGAYYTRPLFGST